MFGKILISGLLLAYLLYIPFPRDWHPSLQWTGYALTQGNRVVESVIKVASVFGYKRWDIMRALTDMEPNRLRELEYGETLVAGEGVEVKKTEWDGVTVFVFTPPESIRDGSGIIYFHGGGWTLLCVESYHDLLIKMAKETGAVVASPNYRKAPENPYPAAFEDCRSVTNYFFDHAESFGVDKARIAMSGDSAGGNLAAAVSIDLTNDDNFQHHLKYLFLVYPSTDLISFNHKSYHYYKDDPILSREFMDRMEISYLGYDGNYRVLEALRKGGHLVDDREKIETLLKELDQYSVPENYRLDIDNQISREESTRAAATLTADEKRHLQSIVFDRRLSPVTATVREMSLLPPTVVLTCQTDPLSDEGMLFLDKLTKAGVETTHIHLRNLPHGIFSLIALIGDVQSTWEDHEDEMVHQQYYRMLREGLA